MPLFDLLRARADATPLAEATVEGALRRDWATLRDRAERLCSAWRALALKPGDRIGFADANTTRFIEASFAAAAGGFVLLPLNTRLGAPEFQRILRDAEPALICTAREHAQIFGGSPVRTVVLGGESCGWEELISTAPAFAGAHCVRPRDPAHLYYTSGTTGEPRGVVLTHSNVETHARAAVEELGLCAGDTWGHIAPMFHLADAWAIVAATLAGARHALLPRFTPADALAFLAAEGVTLTNLVPAMLNSMVQHESAATLRFPRLRRILSGGAPIAPALVERIRSTFRCEYINTYGMTETSPYLTLSLPQPAESAHDNPARRAMTGRPFRTVSLRVVRDDGTPVAQDAREVGEIQVRGPTVTPGYWRNEAATRAAFTDDGFLRTGDLAVQDSLGWIQIVDRRKDVIITGGEKVYTTEVEAALATHEALAECAVFGLPSERWGEEVTAAVVLKRAGAATAEDLMAHCRALLSAWKVPKRVVFLEALPRTGSGKISKQMLRAQAL